MVWYGMVVWFGIGMLGCGMTRRDSKSMRWPLSNAHLGNRRFVSSIRNSSSAAVHSACSSLARECISRSASAPESLLMFITFQRTGHAPRCHRNTGVTRAGDREGVNCILHVECPRLRCPRVFFDDTARTAQTGWAVYLFSRTKNAGGKHNTYEIQTKSLHHAQRYEMTPSPAPP